MWGPLCGLLTAPASRPRASMGGEGFLSKTEMPDQ